MSYLRDLLVLPDVVKKTDFVVDLTASVDHPEALLDRYAITPGIAHAFAVAVGFVKDSLDTRKNAAAYVAASFGAGKSQFMGVLSALLAGHAAPRARPELHGVYASHPWLGEKRLLRLHHNMMSARTMEDSIFRAYLEHLEREHPGAPLPPLFDDEGLFASADALLQDLGEGVFLARLNGAQPAAAGFGDFASELSWDRARYHAARASAEPEERARLLSALARTPWFAGRLRSTGFVELGRGLDAIARHAHALGYQGVILFLDELVLWFASIAGNHDRLSLEVGKLSKLVEGQKADRPIAIVSFIARQRQLIDLVGERFAGEEAVALREQLDFWQGRIDEIVLEDRNLPAIVEKKVVVPKDAAARERLRGDFEGARRRLREAEWGTLLGESDGEAFRQVFPFSPALVEALVALSQCLQRERTAIRILVELLCSRLDDFQPGQLVPVGDLFDVLAAGDEPMDLAMRARFQAARSLYDYELLPVIQVSRGTADASRCQRVRGGAHELGCANCAERGCRADNRLVKTLLLASLVPEVKPLKDLTARRLVALNHGALPSIIPGNEWVDAVGRLRALAAANGKVRVGDQPDPTVSVVLEGVDLRPILEQARVHDNPGARQRKVVEIVYEAMGLASAGEAQTLVDHAVSWRGTARQGQIYAGNLRKMGEELLAAREGDDFRLVLGLPFDEAGLGPREVEQRLTDLAEAGLTSPTVAWQPSFLGAQVMKDLSELVIIDQLLAPGQLQPYFQDRSPQDQQRARAELASLASQKRPRLQRALLAAYGLKADDDELDPASLAERRFHVLLPGLELRGLPAADFASALAEAVRELLDGRFPRHAHFREKVTRGKLEKALDHYEKLCDAESQRLPVSPAEARELSFAEALGLVQVSDVAVARPQLFMDWRRQLLAGSEAEPTVARLHRLGDAEGAAGHPVEVLDFLVLAFASATHRDLVGSDGRPVAEPVVGKLPLDARLVEVELPAETAWQAALDRAGKLWGVALGGRARNPASVNRFAGEVERRRLGAVAGRARDLAGLLAVRSPPGAEPTARQRTAQAVAALLDALAGATPLAAVEAMARFEPVTSLEAMAKHLASAPAVAGALENGMYQGAFEALRGRKGEAEELLGEVDAALAADEVTAPLAPRLAALGARALALLRPAEAVKIPAVAPGSGAAAEVARALASLESRRSDIERDLAAAGPGARVELSWKIVKP